MRTSTKTLFIIGTLLVIGGAFDTLFNGPDVVGLFTLMAAFMKLGIDGI